MTTKIMTKELFAQWSFERDVKVGAERGKWDNLDFEFQQTYLDEADFYLSGGSSEFGYPDDIIDRAKKEGYLLPNAG
jgi:hypothetical protein